ncbi:MAG: glycoside hydrolase family 15 protein, partial [Nitrospinota bacterium]
MYQKIDDYGLIGNMHSSALVSKDGSIDYCSMPQLYSPTVFASILDDEKGGCFLVQPRQEFSSKQAYLENSNILRTLFSTEEGEAALMDFMPVAEEHDRYTENTHKIVRILRGVKGSVQFKVDYTPRPGYAEKLPEVTIKKQTVLTCFDEKTFYLKISGLPVQLPKEKRGKIAFICQVNAGEEIRFEFGYGEPGKNGEDNSDFETTDRYWKAWVEKSDAGRSLDFGEYKEMMTRSLLTLKLLTYAPSGAIAAAATFGLPEAIGGERNWDYRFSWIRDSSFTLKAMFAMGHLAETDSFVRWLQKIYHEYGNNLQIMYSLEGESTLTERELTHLKGYKNSTPVRVGNAAFDQKQWDIYGEVMDTVVRLSDYAGKIDESLWPVFRNICARAARVWKKPDDGIWEVRNGPFHFVYSKIMCWAALDRGVKIAKRYGFEADLALWETEAASIRKEVLEKGVSKTKNCFVQHYETEDMDASLLLIPLMGFLPVQDPIIQNTITSCQQELMEKNFLLRYRGEDGLKGREGGFLLCNFWLVECLLLSGKTEEAERLLGITASSANHLGLLAEEYDMEKKHMLGNFPQAFTHIGYINSVNALLKAKKRREAKPGRSAMTRLKNLLVTKAVLNEPDGKKKYLSKDLAAKLKEQMVLLRGAFFDVDAGKVNYDEMKASKEYEIYSKEVKKLSGFDPLDLKTDSEKISFWINLYNILIIHGVIELAIQESVKEVTNFFDRIAYRVGNYSFSPDDIEHGILRRNKRHPLF